MRVAGTTVKKGHLEPTKRGKRVPLPDKSILGKPSGPKSLNLKTLNPKIPHPWLPRVNTLLKGVVGEGRVDGLAVFGGFRRRHRLK